MRSVDGHILEKTLLSSFLHSSLYLSTLVFVYWTFIIKLNILGKYNTMLEKKKEKKNPFLNDFLVIFCEFSDFF